MGRQLRNPITMRTPIGASLWYTPGDQQRQERAEFVVQKGTNTALIARQGGRIALAHADQLRRVVEDQVQPNRFGRSLPIELGQDPPDELGQDPAWRTRSGPAWRTRSGTRLANSVRTRLANSVRTRLANSVRNPPGELGQDTAWRTRSGPRLAETRLGTRQDPLANSVRTRLANSVELGQDPRWRTQSGPAHRIRTRPKSNSRQSNNAVHCPISFQIDSPVELNCLIFVFTAQPDEIVRLKFEEFDLKPTINNRCHDYVRLYLDSAVAELSSEDPPSYQMCGRQLPQTKFYSSTKILMLEMHAKMSWPYQTRASVNPFRGFRGTFGFEKAAQYQSSGHQMPGSACDREFRSSAGMSGQTTARGDQCRYYFRGGKGERVRVDLRGISLEGGDGRNATACERLSPARRDHLLVYQTDSEFGKNSAVLAHYSSFCGGVGGAGSGGGSPGSDFVSVISQDDFLLVKFVANSDSVTGSGFAGRFAFVARH
uniref:CUB domain-containing protein n=1 Tax=Macrostomum lignano TaxID=282301 RepID=A0A1I8IV34_9PLAT